MRLLRQTAVGGHSVRRRNGVDRRRERGGSRGAATVRGLPVRPTALRLDAREFRLQRQQPGAGAGLEVTGSAGRGPFADPVDGAGQCRLITEQDLLMPVPLHWRRHLARRFNQSAALAQALARRTGATFAPDWVVRTRNTPPIKAMSQRERLQNVRDAFLVPERYRAGLEGRSVVIVDDVHTTGATIHALCDELRAHGVAHIGVVVVALVIGNHHLSRVSEPL